MQKMIVASPTGANEMEFFSNESPLFVNETPFHKRRESVNKTVEKHLPD